MRVVTVAVGSPAASVAVEVMRVYHGGSTWVGGDSMQPKECNYRAVKKKMQISLVESVGVQNLVENSVRNFTLGQPIQSLQ
jgi:hypothetical protein